ncbi:hypothetical protein BK816_08530 [Boudabousia tangfeifanii]|uniref:Uncharacterized protein n=1 Tax=Boudabousia tangfeifanii TaxID=1912795 RepID=A0A1D9MLY4_9ACTO|nr:hypothetical protein [Boudabousia tangfeifanii]AOZ73317.1 hypothetical protein BK816_08530 [Boudabousia tangfeifanii]
MLSVGVDALREEYHTYSDGERFALTLPVLSDDAGVLAFWLDDQSVFSSLTWTRHDCITEVDPHSKYVAAFRHALDQHAEHLEKLDPQGLLPHAFELLALKQPMSLTNLLRYAQEHRWLISIISDDFDQAPQGMLTSVDDHECQLRQLDLETFQLEDENTHIPLNHIQVATLLSQEGLLFANYLHKLSH